MAVRPEIVRVCSFADIFIGAPMSSLLQRARQIASSFAIYEWILFVYLGVFSVLSLAKNTPDSPRAFAFNSGLFVLMLLTAIINRTLGEKHARGIAVFSRVMVFVGFAGALLGMSYVFVAFPQACVDKTLLHLDLSWFGVEPALYFDRWAEPHLVEWFSFYYFGSIVLVAIFALVVVFLTDNPALVHEFTIAMPIVMIVGHFTYFLVPAKGPLSLPLFSHGLHGHLWWPMVQNLVEAVGARRDVFPSLHTAHPIVITIFAYRHRKITPIPFLWQALLFVTIQVIISTMFLRWHYLIDVIAGAVLGVSAGLLGGYLTPREEFWRAKRNIGPVWLKLRWKKDPTAASSVR